MARTPGNFSTDRQETGRLVRPSTEYVLSHDAYLAELRKAGEESVPWVLDEVCDSFDDYIGWLNDQSRGVGLAPGFVPSSTFWLVDNAGEIVAISNLRHSLTDSLRHFGGHIGYGVRPSARRRGHATEVLRLTLVEARRLGIDQVLVTCDRENTGSIRAIVRNGGRLFGEEFVPQVSRVVQRYWIGRR